ncbi:MAG: bacillithiol biosynthesis deacetylase BshB1 [Ignavibacteria bacterium]
MFFGAHPDDVELNCGGTVLNLTASGKKIGIVDLTLGELSTRGDLKTRNKETEKASELLRISARENLKIGDGNIRINDENIKKVIVIIRKFKPEIIFAPYPHDRHPDHVNASNLLRESYFYSGLNKIKTPGLDAFRPKKIFYYRNAYDAPVSFIIDITASYKRKIEVLKCFGSQFYDQQNNEPETFISSKLFQYEIESRARHFGFKIGVEFGEPYYSYEAIKVNEKSLFEI